MAFPGLRVPKLALASQWTDRKVASDNIICTWPPQSPDRQFVVSSKTMFTSLHFRKHCQNCKSASALPARTSNMTCLGGLGKYGGGGAAWTSAVSHAGCTSNMFMVSMKLQTFLFQTVVVSHISVLFSVGGNKLLQNQPIICAHLVDC